MKKYWVGQTLALVTALTFSSALCAQTSPKTEAKMEKAPAPQGLPRTADGKPDFSGDAVGQSGIRNDKAVLGSTCRRGFHRSRQSNDRQ